MRDGWQVPALLPMRVSYPASYSHHQYIFFIYITEITIYIIVSITDMLGYL